MHRYIHQSALHSQSLEDVSPKAPSILKLSRGDQGNILIASAPGAKPKLGYTTRWSWWHAAELHLAALTVVILSDFVGLHSARFRQIDSETIAVLHQQP